ncbi:hypothetical protein JCM11641_005378 [Rhodosporidiobolus odoratus]
MATLQPRVQTAALSPSPSPAADRFSFLLFALTGQQVTTTLKGGIRVRGILAAATPQDGDLSLALRQAVYLTASSSAKDGEVKSSLLINGRDLLEIEADDVDVSLFPAASANDAAGGKEKPVQAKHAAAENEETFRTDTDISGRRVGQERKLQAWGEGIEDDSLEVGGGLSASANGRLGGGGPASGGGGWDQFAANERQFGLKTDYDEEIYTTKLDKSGRDFKAREAKAAQLEREIMTGSSGITNNAHIAEERGELVPDNGMNEEDRYGAVIRSEGAYVPPGARKAALARLQSNQNSAASSPSSAAPNGSAKPSAAPPTGPAASRLPQTSRIPPTASASAAPSSTSSTTPTPAAAPAIAGAAPAQPGQGTAHQHFREFVTDERKRLVAKKAQIVQQAQKKEQDSKLASLLQWSQTFKNPYPLPDDLATILGKKKLSSTASNSGEPTKSTAASTATSPSGQSRPLPAVSPSPAAPSAKASPAPSTSSSFQAKKPASRPLIPEIPPFNPARAKQRQAELAAQRVSTSSVNAPTADEGPSASAPAPATTAAPSALSHAPIPAPSPSVSPALSAKAPTLKKLSATAGAFVFKPNPSAASFTPGAKASPAVSPAVSAATVPSSSALPPAAPAKQAASASGVAAALNPNANPFFGPTPKRGSSSFSLHVKEDFTPFRNARTLPSPETVNPGWPFTGKPSRAMYPPGSGVMSAQDQAAQQQAMAGQHQQGMGMGGPPPQHQHQHGGMMGPMGMGSMGMPPMQFGPPPPSAQSLAVGQAPQPVASSVPAQPPPQPMRHLSQPPPPPQPSSAQNGVGQVFAGQPQTPQQSRFLPPHLQHQHHPQHQQQQPSPTPQAGVPPHLQNMQMQPPPPPPPGVPMNGPNGPGPGPGAPVQFIPGVGAVLQANFPGHSHGQGLPGPQPQYLNPAQAQGMMGLPPHHHHFAAAAAAAAQQQAMGMGPMFAQGQGGPMFTSHPHPHLAQHHNSNHPHHPHSPVPPQQGGGGHMGQQQQQQQHLQRASMPPWAPPFQNQNQGQGQQGPQAGAGGPGTPVLGAHAPTPATPSSAPPPAPASATTAASSVSNPVQAGPAQGMPPQFIQPPPPSVAAAGQQ